MFTRVVSIIPDYLIYMPTLVPHDPSSSGKGFSEPCLMLWLATQRQQTCPSFYLCELPAKENLMLTDELPLNSVRLR